MNENSKNALALKLEYLEKRYLAFSPGTNKPLLRWLTDPGDEEIVRAFVAYEQGGGLVDDLLVDMTVPFEDEATYAKAATADLNRQYEEDKPGMDEEGLDTGWRLPEIKEDESDIQYMLRAFADFHAYHVDVYKGAIHHLTIFLRPKTVSDPSAFVRWMESLIHFPPPEGIRFAVLDEIALPRFDASAEQAPERVHSEPLRLDYPAMLEDLAKGEDNQKGPEARFRVLFMKLSNQAEKQDVEGVEETAAEALAVAEAQGWHQMRVVVHMVRGADFLQAGRADDALSAYKEALETAREAKAAEDPAGDKLEIQALFAAASVLLSRGDYTEACELYEEAAALAEEAKDNLLTMEGRRMAGFCHEMNKQYAQSIQCLNLGIEAGERIPKDERNQSTLPYVGDALLRVIKAAEKGGLFRSRKELPDLDEVNDKMIELLGEKWQSNVVRTPDGKTQPA